MYETRVLDSQAVEAAEFARKNGLYIEALRLSEVGLGYRARRLTHEEVAHISSDADQLTTLAELARIHVDSAKSVANASLNPRRILLSLERAADTISTVYEHPSVRANLRALEADRASKQYFTLEMQRDRLKVSQAARPLFNTVDAQALVDSEFDKLSDEIASLPQGHSLRPFLTVEQAIFRGVIVGESEFMAQYREFVHIDLEERPNPNRVAAISAQIIARDMIHAPQNRAFIEKTYADLVAQHPEWGFMIQRESQKVSLSSKREKIVRVASLLTVSPSRRRRLFDSLNQH
jgi:hypothetical protein